MSKFSKFHDELTSSDNSSLILHTKFYASRIKNKQVSRGTELSESPTPQVQQVFKSPGKVGLSQYCVNKPVSCGNFFTSDDKGYRPELCKSSTIN